MAGYATAAASLAGYADHIRHHHGAPSEPLQFGRPFALQRDRDVSGVSGVGIVADGCLWPDGTASIRWRGDRPSTTAWSSVDDLIAIHGHDGATRIIWADNTTHERSPDSVRTLPDTASTCKDTLSADIGRTPSDTDLTDPATLRHEYAAAIRAHSWAAPGTGIDAITDSVIAVHDRAQDALRTSLALEKLKTAKLEAATHLLARQARRVRRYAESRATAKGDNIASASWILHILDGTDQADEQRPPLPRRQRHAR
ncbi:hypothetical protein [Streptomyces sp. NPDC053079]|uniref:hypothetical protein n=1 Tax=Streptomyces sp. NPDC053079 TaxID=3365697 RepID=UPI0037D10C2A